MKPMINPKQTTIKIGDCVEVSPQYGHYGMAAIYARPVTQRDSAARIMSIPVSNFVGRRGCVVEAISEGEYLIRFERPQVDSDNYNYDLAAFSESSLKMISPLELFADI